MKRPCATPFLDPVSTEEAPDYHNVVKKPVDLGTIRKRLAENEYQSVAAWAREMSLIWANAEKFNGRDSVLHTVALQIKRAFDKEYRKVRILGMRSWVNTVSEMKDILDGLLDSPPDPVTRFATISEKPDPNQPKQFTDDEMEQFIKSTTKLTSEQDGNRMLRIIQTHEQGFKGTGSDKEIDVNELSVATLHALREFVNQRLADMSTPTK